MTIHVAYSTEVDFSPLTIRAETDKATGEVNFLLETLTVRDANSDLAGKRALRSQTREMAAVADLDADIAELEEYLTLTSLTPATRQEKSDEAESLRIRRRKLLKADAETPGYTRFMANVAAGGADGQVAFLQAVLAGLVAHRATLTS